MKCEGEDAMRIAKGLVDAAAWLIIDADDDHRWWRNFRTGVYVNTYEMKNIGTQNIKPSYRRRMQETLHGASTKKSISPSIDFLLISATLVKKQKDE